MASRHTPVVLVRLTLCLSLTVCAWLGRSDAVTLSFPDGGLRFRDLAGEVGEFSWSAPNVVVRGSLVPVGAGLRGTLEIDASGVVFHDEGYRRAAEGLRVEGTIEIVDMTDDATVVRVDLLIGSGEVLVEEFYLDLATFPIAVSGLFEWPGPGATNRGGTVKVSGAEIAMAGVGVAKGGGRIAMDGGDIDVAGTIDVHGLSRLYDLVATKPADERRYRIETRGGMVAQLDYRRDSSGDFSLNGTLNLHDGAVFATDPVFRLSGLEIELPIALGTSELADVVGRGRASFEEGTILGGPVGAMALDVEVRPNSIRLAAPVRVRVFGGAMTLRSFDSSELASADRKLKLALDLDAIDLEKLSRGIGIPRVVGSISASIPEIEIGSGTLRSEGELAAEVFGGKVRARNLRGDGLFSTVPTFGFDLDFESISLAPLTRTLSFGYISGVAKGSVRDLEFVSWGPVAFTAELETYPASGVSQRVSVDAIRQISIVGGGASDPFSESIMRFFAEYRYAKLGFRCRLHNDVFELDGVEERDGDHYLVVGSMIPPRVNVVSHVRRISFSDMISRIGTASY